MIAGELFILLTALSPWFGEIASSSSSSSLTLNLEVRSLVELAAPGGSPSSELDFVLREDRCAEPLGQLRARPSLTSASRGLLWCGQEVMWIRRSTRIRRDADPSRQLWIYIRLFDGTKGWLWVSSERVLETGDSRPPEWVPRIAVLELSM
jgi:hypothetical protein